MLTRSIGILAGITMLVSAGSAAAESDKDTLIESALSAAPPAIAETATVMDMKGNILREGSGAFTCFPREGEGGAPMCLDAEWLTWADAWMNRKSYAPSGLGLAYMLAGDSPDGGASNIDPFATEATADNQWVVEGPHIMILLSDPAMLDEISTDPTTGEPYVMWKGTPYAHIMMPVATAD
jgi:hypothetical protein